MKKPSAKVQNAVARILYAAHFAAADFTINDKQPTAAIDCIPSCFMNWRLDTDAPWSLVDAVEVHLNELGYLNARA